MDLENIISGCDGLINKIISKYRYYYEYDDLYQVASIGIIKAYHNFNPDKNVKFSTYAYTYILGEVVKFVNENKGLKSSIEYRTLGKKIEEARTVLTQRLMKEPSDVELANFLNLSSKLISDISFSNKAVTSLNQIVSDDGKELTLLETIVGPSYIPSDNEFMVKDLINNLQEPERSILSLAYLKDYTQDMISKEIGLNQVQISRKLSKSKNNLKKILNNI